MEEEQDMKLKEEKILMDPQEEPMEEEPEFETAEEEIKEDLKSEVADSSSLPPGWILSYPSGEDYMDEIDEEDLNAFLEATKIIANNTKPVAGEHEKTVKDEKEAEE